MFKRLFCEPGEGGVGRGVSELVSSLNADVHHANTQTAALMAAMLR